MTQAIIAKVSLIILTRILDILRPFHSNLVEKNKHVTCRPKSVHIGKKMCLEFGYWLHMQDLARFFPIQTSRMANI